MCVWHWGCTVYQFGWSLVVWHFFFLSRAQGSVTVWVFLASFKKAVLEKPPTGTDKQPHTLSSEEAVSLDRCVPLYVNQNTIWWQRKHPQISTN